MSITSEPLVFFGSGPVASSSLENLIKNFQIEAVVTKKSPNNLNPVIDVANQHATKILFAENSAQLLAIITSSNLKSKVGVVIDYGIIIPQKVIDFFPLGIVNSHFSLLPQWRGADPITFAILSGQKKSGVSLMLINNKMDEGPLLSQAIYNIKQNINVLQLTEDLIDLSNALINNILPLYIEGSIAPAPQEQATLSASKIPSYSRKILKSDGIIDWNKPAEEIEREIRAFLGWPGSRTQIGDKDIIITKAHLNTPPTTTAEDPGQISSEQNNLVIQTGNGQLVIDNLKPAGKNEMTAQEFLRGYGHVIN